MRLTRRFMEVVPRIQSREEGEKKLANSDLRWSASVRESPFVLSCRVASDPASGEHVLGDLRRFGRIELG